MLSELALNEAIDLYIEKHASTYQPNTKHVANLFQAVHQSTSAGITEPSSKSRVAAQDDLRACMKSLFDDSKPARVSTLDNVTSNDRLRHSNRTPRIPSSFAASITGTLIAHREKLEKFIKQKKSTADALRYNKKLRNMIAVEVESQKVKNVFLLLLQDM